MLLFCTENTSRLSEDLTATGSPARLEKVQYFHPGVEVYTVNTKNEINKMGYLVRSPGAIGNCLFQTK